MKPIFKKILLFALLAALLGTGSVWYFIFYRPSHQQRDMTAVAFVLSAAELVKDFQTDEAAANKKYLNQTVQLTGVVGDTAHNQMGQPTVLLKSGDDFTSVYCTLQTPHSVVPGASVTLVGVCTGFLTDVVISEAIIQ